MSDYRDWLFRGLSEEQINDMRQWAWDNYKPGDAVKSYWHQIVRRECERIEGTGNEKNASCDEKRRTISS